jgi:FkbM family methyltransferase
MKTVETKLAAQPKYLELLGRAQAVNLLELFEEIEKGKYDKEELHAYKLKDLDHAVYIRAIRADMQSFINTFIDPYLDKKPYLQNTEFVIDAGANIGYTAVLFANWWPESRIVSIEPDKENYELVLRNTKPYANISVIHGAVWNKEAELSIEAGQEDGFVVREITKSETELKKENQTIGIPLEMILRESNASQIDFLKMNIEGSEKELFRENYNPWLSKTKAMLIELHDGKNPGCSQTVFTTTNQYDFSVAETAAYGILFVRENIYKPWYAKWYREEIYDRNIDKERFPKFYLDTK